MNNETHQKYIHAISISKNNQNKSFWNMSNDDNMYIQDRFKTLKGRGGIGAMIIPFYKGR